MVAGTDSIYGFVRKYGIKTAFGTDILFSEEQARRQNHLLAEMTRWFTPAEALRMATATNGELLALSGLRSPYEGKLGVVETGALADLLLVDGDPLKDIRVIEDPEAELQGHHEGRRDLQEQPRGRLTPVSRKPQRIPCCRRLGRHCDGGA